MHRAWIVLALALLGAPRDVRADDASTLADGAAAPANTWHVTGGAASRSGRTLTRPLTGPFEEGWAIAIEGTLEGDPLVWRDHIVFTEQRAANRWLHVVRATDGTPIGEPIGFKTTLPLEACLWNRLVVVRSAERVLQVYRIRDDEVKGIWEYRGTADLHGPLLYGHELYVREGGAIARLMPGLAEPVWRKGGKYCGAPSLYGRSVFTLTEEMGTASVVVLSRDTGDPQRTIGAGPIDSGGRGSVCVGEHYILACGNSGGAAGYFPNGPERPGPGTLFVMRYAAPPATWGRHFLAFSRQEADIGLHLAEPGEKEDSQYYILASQKSHASYARHPAAISVAGGIAFAGRFAVRVEDRKIVWRCPESDVRRVIPTRDGLLVARDKGLTALQRRGLRKMDRRPVFLADHFADPVHFELEKGRVLLDDGTELKGTLRIDRLADTFELVRGKKSDSYPLTKISFLEDATGRTIALPSIDRTPRLVHSLIEHEMAGLYGDLTQEAVKANSAELLREILGEAYLAGAPDQDLDRGYKKLVSLSGQRGSPKAKIVESVKAARATLPATALDKVWARVGELPGKAPADLRLAICRVILETSDAHGAAAAAVRALVPATITVPEPFRPLEWLDFLEAGQHAGGIEVITPAAEGGTREQQLLAQYRTEWRPDLIGIQSEGLVVLAPTLNLGGIARSLAYGELLCRTLDGMFSDALRVEKSRQRLLVLLYENKEEYEKHLPVDARGHGLSWTAGVYSLGVSRMYLPAGEDDFLAVLPVFLHELTHHWVDERGPRLEASGSRTSDGPGYWIVEGFARFAEEFRLDPQLRLSSTDNPESGCLDTITQTETSAHVSWKRLLDLGNVGFHQLNGDPNIKAAHGWVLGQQRVLNERILFYDQSAALCHYLYHAEDGKHRALLLRFLQSYYSGKNLDLCQELGLSADEIGTRVLDYARQHEKW